MMVNTVYCFLRPHPGLPGPEAVVCGGGSRATFSPLGAGEGTGEGAAEPLVLALELTDPLSLENFT